MSNDLRPLSTLERLLWLHDQSEPTHFSVSGLIEGATTLEQWKMALASLQGRHVLFRVSIQTDENGVPFVREEAEAPMPLRFVECNAEEQLEQEVSREISTPFYSPARAPLVRATLLYENKRSIVILVAHHSIADGISLAYAIRDLLHPLTGKALEPLPVPPSHEELLGIVEDPAESVTSGVSGSINPDFFKLVPQVSSLRLSRNLTTGLRERAQLEGTSVHAALLASPISTRKLLNQGDICTMLTDIAMQLVSFPESGDFWELARNLKADLAPQVSLERIAGSRLEFRRLLATAHNGETVVQIVRRHSRSDFMLSNLGDQELETQGQETQGLETQAGRLRLEAIWGPAILMGCREEQQFLGAATANGRLSFLYSSYTPIPLLLETMEITLAEAVQDSTRVLPPRMALSPELRKKPAGVANAFAVALWAIDFTFTNHGASRYRTCCICNGSSRAHSE